MRLRPLVSVKGTGRVTGDNESETEESFAYRLEGCEQPAAHSSDGTGLAWHCKAYVAGDVLHAIPSSVLRHEHYHPDAGIGLCKYACPHIVVKAWVEGDFDKADQLEGYFGFRRTLLLRQSSTSSS